MDFQHGEKSLCVAEEIRKPVEGLQIILKLYFYVQIEILFDRQPEIITKLFKLQFLVNARVLSLMEK